MPERPGFVLAVPPDLAALEGVAERLAAFAAAQDAPARAGQHLVLALEELLANVIDHARPEAPIGLRVWREPDAIAVEIEDGGLAYDPFARAAPDTAAALENREPGGLGVHFVRTLMDSYAWRREAGRNITTIRKQF